MSGDGADHRTITFGPARGPAPPFTTAMAATALNARTMRHQFQDWVTPVLPGAPAADLVLAVSEALANAVDHAFVTRDDVGRMRLTATTSPEHVEVTVTDDGTWLAPTGPGNRGRGIPLMHHLVSSARIDSGPLGTVVHLRQRRPPG